MKCKICGREHGCDNPECNFNDIVLNINRLEKENSELRKKVELK